MKCRLGGGCCISGGTVRATNPLGSGQEGERLLLSASSSPGAVQGGRSDPGV